MISNCDVIIQNLWIIDWKILVYNPGAPKKYPRLTNCPQVIDFAFRFLTSLKSIQKLFFSVVRIHLFCSHTRHLSYCIAAIAFICFWDPSGLDGSIGTDINHFLFCLLTSPLSATLSHPLKLFHRAVYLQKRAAPGEVFPFLIPRNTFCRSQGSFGVFDQTKQTKKVTVKLVMDLLSEIVHFNTLLNITRILSTSSNSYSKFVKQLSCAEWEDDSIFTSQLPLREEYSALNFESNQNL